METQNRCFDYEKSIVINALYDTIDDLELYLDSSNSARGTLIVSDAQQTGRVRIALTVAENSYRTQVDVYPQDSDRSGFDIWAAIILDELFGTIQRAQSTGKRKEHYSQQRL